MNFLYVSILPIPLLNQLRRMEKEGLLSEQPCQYCNNVSLLMSTDHDTVLTNSSCFARQYSDWQSSSEVFVAKAHSWTHINTDDLSKYRRLLESSF